MGTWSLGTKREISEFIDIIEQLKRDFDYVVGDDEVFDSLDLAIQRAKDLETIAKHEQDN